MNLKRFGKLVKFLAAGLPSFLVAVPLNWLFVDVFGMHKGLAYGIVLVFQVATNFFMLRWFVFPKESKTSLLRDFLTFFLGIMFFRFADWCVYYLLVNVFGFYYLAVQLANVVIFATLKFFFSDKALK